MPPIPHRSLITSSSLHHRSSQDLKHASDSSSSTGQSAPLISLIITTIILSILAAGASLYLARLLWLRIILPKQEERRKQKLLSEKERALEDMAAYFGDSATLGSPGVNGDGEGGDEKATLQKTAREEVEKVMVRRGGQRKKSVVVVTPAVGGDGLNTRKSVVPAKAGGTAARGRSYSDAVWSPKLDHESSSASLSSSSSDDEGEDKPINPRQSQYGIARGSGRGLLTGNYMGRHISMASVPSASLPREGEEPATVKKRRSRFMSVGGVPQGFRPLGMNPVSEDDLLVDVPLPNRTEPTRGAAEMGVVADRADGFRDQAMARESWPLRSMMAS